MIISKNRHCKTTKHRNQHTQKHIEPDNDNSEHHNNSNTTNTHIAHTKTHTNKNNTSGTVEKARNTTHIKTKNTNKHTHKNNHKHKRTPNKEHANHTTTKNTFKRIGATKKTMYACKNKQQHHK